MRVVTNRRLVEFAMRHPAAWEPLQAWRRVMESRAFHSFADLKQAFNSVDKVAEWHVFDIGGNKYRLIAFLHMEHQIAYVKQVMPHREYELGKWKKS